MNHACCAPERPIEHTPTIAPNPAKASSRLRTDLGIPFASLAGGCFEMGNPRGDGAAADGEGPVHPITLSPFAIATTTVTVRQFAAFVTAKSPSAVAAE